MDIEVSDEAARAATKCMKGRACLKGEGANVCKVVRLVNKSLHYISVDSDSSCPYNCSFGCYRHCNCPVRKELYKNSKI